MGIVEEVVKIVDDLSEIKQCSALENEFERIMKGLRQAVAEDNSMPQEKKESLIGEIDEALNSAANGKKENESNISNLKDRILELAKYAEESHETELDVAQLKVYKGLHEREMQNLLSRPDSKTNGLIEYKIERNKFCIESLEESINLFQSLDNGLNATSDSPSPGSK